jgi:hypothetical protein
LEFNILHVEALAQVLGAQVPEPEEGEDRNLDRIGLDEFRQNAGRFDVEGCVVQELRSQSGERTERTEKETLIEKRGRDCLEFNIPPTSNEIGLIPHVQVRIRDILVLPLLGIGFRGLVTEALRMGIEKAEAKQKDRLGSIGEEGESLGSGESTVAPMSSEGLQRNRRSPAKRPLELSCTVEGPPTTKIKLSPAKRRLIAELI